MKFQTLPSAERALVFEDPASRALLERIERIGASDATTLITGETGTGKGLVARRLHALGPRRHRPFLALNCGAIPESLVESELFGHERGAFTGAAQARAGWFEAAHGGTLFLDELGDLPLAAQAKLLRVLQEREVVRVGSRTPLSVDVRLVAATNVDVGQQVARGRMRSDLYYRVNVASIHLPALRDRPGDILPLARHFLERHRPDAGVLTFSSAATERLVAHTWPGNIRELENVVHRAVVGSVDGLIQPGDLALGSPADGASGPTLAALEAALVELFQQGPANLHATVEEAVIRVAYHFSERNQLQTARLLGISRNVVRARLMQIGELAPDVRWRTRSEPAISRSRTGPGG